MGYEVRHIVCPLCEKGFTFFLMALDYEIKGHEGQWEKLSCPKCGMTMFVSNTQNYVLPAEETEAVRNQLTM
jgi:C4-type Zn-finger protein